MRDDNFARKFRQKLAKLKFGNFLDKLAKKETRNLAKQEFLFFGVGQNSTKVDKEDCCGCAR